MTKHIHTAEFNGQTFKRTSQTRRYTHVVVARLSYAHALAAATSSYSRKSDADTYKYYRSIIDGTYAPLKDWHPTLQEDILKRAREHLAGYESLEQYTADRRAAAIASVEKAKAEGKFDSFGAVGWASRPDLAQKVANQYGGKPYWEEVRILPAACVTK